MTGSTWSAVEGMATAKASRVAVIGASGYGGLQTIRLLQGHPALSVTFLGGERSAGQRWSSVCSFLPLPDDPLVQSADPDRIAEAADFAVLSLPNGLACRMAPELIARGVRVVDLSADFRYRSLDQWNQVYAQEAKKVQRDDAELCRRAVYGLPEWHGPAIAEASLVAAPGCFPTASLLPLLPFLKQGLIETDGIIIDAKTGTSGGGRVPKEAMLLAEASNRPAYVIGHRHTSEIEQMAQEVAGKEIQLQFTPHLVPMVRVCCRQGARSRPRPDGRRLHHRAEAIYRHHPCVTVLPVGTYSATKWARFNRALLSVQVDKRTGRLILMSTSIT